MADVRGVGNISSRGARDVSPDSVILTFDSHFGSLFSSASASVDRCSFASDAVDHDSLSADLSQHLGRRESLSGPDLDLPHSNKNPATSNSSSFLCQKVVKAKVRREYDNKKVFRYHEDDDEIQALDSARSSFSLALKECQERRSRSEALIKKLERQRPASLDLNNPGANVVSSSPRLGGLKKTSVLSQKLGNFPSPGTPNYRHGSVMGVSKGWSSERVPLPNNANRRQVGAAMLPLNNSRALPSKWEDAERWILSPVAGDGTGRHSSCQQHQMLRRPKSKSGPLGPPAVAYYSLYSPAVPMYEGSNLSFHMAGSPFSAGVMVADGLSFHERSGINRSFSNILEPCIARSASVHGYTDLVCQNSLTSSQDEKVDDSKDAAINVSRAISRRDMATQMSPEDSCPSSPRRTSFSPSITSILPIVEVQSCTSSKSEVRDVQIDEKVTVTRWSKKCRGRSKGSEDVDDWKLKAVEPRSSAWEVSDTVKSVSKARREEAKIIAWENLQKAKAEAAIRKLEMKLEKKRASSMDKIMKKLRSTHKKAQEMRSAVLTNQAVLVSKSNENAMSIHRTHHMGSFSGCFTCHAF